MLHRALSKVSNSLRRRFSVAVGTIVAFITIDLLLLTMCLFALRQNNRLRDDILYDLALLTPAKGTLVPPLAGKDSAGAIQTVTFEQDSRPTLIYTFSQHCGHCEQDWPAMHSLQALAPQSVRIVYVDTTNERFTPEYLATTGIRQSTLLVRLSPDSALVYDAHVIPQLLLVDHRGLVRWAHVGDLTSADISAARSLIQRY